jgi:hypothetical protein
LHINYVASIDGNPHAAPAQKEHALKVEKAHGIVIEGLRNETTDNETESARYFSGEGGDFIHLEQDKIGVQNTYLPWLGHNRSKTNSGYTDKLQMQLMMHCIAGTLPYRYQSLSGARPALRRRHRAVVDGGQPGHSFGR